MTNRARAAGLQRWTSLRGLTDEQRRAHARKLANEAYARRSMQKRASRPLDPLMEIDPIDLAYMAGLIDGEGTICCLSHARGKTCYPIVSITMTDFAVIEWVAKKWRVARSIHQRDRLGYLPQAAIRLSGERAQLLCRLLLPYLKVKHRQAELVQTFPISGAQAGPKVKIDAALNARRFALRDEVNNLNLRPRNAAYRRGRDGSSPEDSDGR